MTATTYDALFGTGNNIRQVVSTDFSPNNRIEAGRVSAGVDPAALFLVDSKPTARVQSMDLAGVLAIVSATAGLDIDSVALDGNIDLPWQFRAAGGTFAGTLSHSIIRGTNGLIVPTSISVNQGDSSVIDLMVHYESTDGFTVPVSQVDDQTLAAQAFNAMFGLGPALLDGSALAGCIGHTVNPGLTVEPEQVDGAVYPTAHFLVLREPTIDVRFRDFDSLAAAALIAAAMTSCSVTHRKRSEGGAFVANGTAEHVSFSFADGITSVQNVTGQGNQPAIPTLRLHGEALTVSTSATIS